MPALTIQSETKEYVKVAVSGTESGTAINPTLVGVPAFSFPLKGVEATTWVNGEWETAGSTYYARILVSGTGAGGTVVLAEGVYDVWVKWIDNPEAPVRKAGQLKVL